MSCCVWCCAWGAALGSAGKNSTPPCRKRRECGGCAQTRRALTPHTCHCTLFRVRCASVECTRFVVLCVQCRTQVSTCVYTSFLVRGAAAGVSLPSSGSVHAVPKGRLPSGLSRTKTTRLCVACSGSRASCSHLSRGKWSVAPQTCVTCPHASPSEGVTLPGQLATSATPCSLSTVLRDMLHGWLHVCRTHATSRCPHLSCKWSAQRPKNC